VDDVIVVVGHEAETIARNFSGSGLAARFVVNADYDRGQMLDRPLSPYNSSQPDTMDRQVREARDAGTDDMNGRGHQTIA